MPDWFAKQLPVIFTSWLFAAMLCMHMHEILRAHLRGAADKAMIALGGYLADKPNAEEEVKQLPVIFTSWLFAAMLCMTCMKFRARICVVLQKER